MAKISKKQALVNTVICDVIVALADFEQHKISKETLEYAYKMSRGLVWHFDEKGQKEFREHAAIREVKALLEAREELLKFAASM